MFLATALNTANVHLYFVVLFTVVLRLNQIQLSLLSKKRTDVLPFFWIVLRPVEISRKFNISLSISSQRQSKSMAEISPGPFCFCVERIKHEPVVVLRMVNHLHLRVEINRVLFTLQSWFEPIGSDRNEP